MADALYGPRGYYTTPRPILGRQGDFTTTPKLTETLSKAIASWIKSRWIHHGQKLPVIELGPGDGSLAKSIRGQFSHLARRKLNYHFVEISPHLRERQLAAVKGQATSHPTLTEAFQTAGNKALILSNEFFDAFPVRIFKKEVQGFSELYLENAKEIWQPTALLPNSTFFENDWPAGQRLEVAESIHTWMTDQLAQLNSGSLLSIDYGNTADKVYHRRPMGTLRAYAHHQLLVPPATYLNPGKQDLTFDVNFSDLSQWASELGITQLTLESQAAFIAPHGPGLGREADGAFQVLHQEKS
ncbi:MAG: SAM-dependent methyltransferase [Akkermansiaceae bacterium]